MTRLLGVVLIVCACTGSGVAQSPKTFFLSKFGPFRQTLHQPVKLLGGLCRRFVEKATA
jgi:hypothetical protein